MKRKILIISPHFPPSNLAAVHRSRLFSQHLPSFGWEPVILTVNEKYYEEEPDWNLSKLLPPSLRIEKCSAFKVSKPRIVGDIGLRGFFQLYRKAKKLILSEKFDFLYIPVPSFYVALLGRWLHHSTGIKYGIDYVDPWVHIFPGSDKKFSRHWFSTRLAKILEPLAIKKASLITGVAEGYYEGVQQRNPHLLNSCLFGAMPYGGEIEDHHRLSELSIKPYLFEKNSKLKLVYAGAMLPKAYGPMESMFKAIASDIEKYADVEFHFIGTGKTPNDPVAFNIKPMAVKYGLWQTIVFEYPKRIPYLDVLVHLHAADAVFILGSTEPHYTPSKTYQGVLSEKPVLAILHTHSTAVNILRSSKAGLVLDFSGEEDVQKINRCFNIVFNEFRVFARQFRPAQVDRSAFNQYSAKAVTGQLASLLDKASKTQG